MSENQPTPVRVAHIKDGKLTFSKGFDMGYVDPYYQYSDDWRDYQDGSRVRLNVPDISDKEIIVPHCYHGHFVNWFKGAEELFEKKINKLMERNIDEKHYLAYAYIEYKNEKTVRFWFDGGVAIEGEIHTNYKDELYVRFSEKDLGMIKEKLDIGILNNCLREVGVSITTSHLDDRLGVFIANLKGSTKLSFYIKGWNIYVEQWGRAIKAPMADLIRHDLDTIRKGVKQGYLDAMFEEVMV